MSKSEAEVDRLANKLTKVHAQTSLQYHVKVKAEVLVVENVEALGSKLTYTIR